MFSISKTFGFEAAHRLPYHDGKCRRLHGHSWKATLTVVGEKLQKEGAKKGMLVDFGYFDDVIRELRDNYLDHWCLNDTLPDPYKSDPTSENVAQFIYAYANTRLQIYLANYGAVLESVAVEETCSCRAVYKS